MNGTDTDNRAQGAESSPAPAMLSTRLGDVEYAKFGKGPAVMCLHGAMGGFDQGLILAKTLGPDGFSYLAPSRPGYLGSPLSLGPSLKEQADIYAAMLDALGIEKTAIIAVSGGGPSALRFAIRHPERLWGLVLVSTCASKVTKKPPLAFRIMKLIARFPPAAERIRRKAVNHPENSARRSITDPDLYAGMLADKEAWSLMKELQISTASRMAERLEGTTNDIFMTRSRTYNLEEISAPTLILHGTRDPFLPFSEHGQVLANRIPGSRLIPLEGGEHAAIFSHLAESRAGVAEFLKEHEPRQQKF